jgi:hypothetical protein
MRGMGEVYLRRFDGPVKGGLRWNRMVRRRTKNKKRKKRRKKKNKLEGGKEMMVDTVFFLQSMHMWCPTWCPPPAELGGR